MAVLVAYASKHGSTQGIAEHITEKLRQLGKEVEVKPLDAVEFPGSYEVLVIGSAIYYGSWLKEATEWVRRNRAVLAKLPVWLFSVGPLGTEVSDAEQQPQADPHTPSAGQPPEYREEFHVMGEQLVTTVEQLIHEGNVRRIIIKQEGHTVLEIPLTIGVVGVLIAPLLAAVGAIGAAVTNCTIEVVPTEPPEQTGGPPPAQGTSQPPYFAVA